MKNNWRIFFMLLASAVALSFELGLAANSAFAQAPLISKPKAPFAVSIVKGQDDKPAYCLAEAPYDNGLSLLLALSPNQELNLGLLVPEAGFTAGEAWDMKLNIDDTLLRMRPAEAVEPEVLRQNFGADNALLNGLQRGKVLRLSGALDEIWLSLEGSGRAIAQLKDCVKQLNGASVTPKAEPKPKAAGNLSEAAPSTTKAAPTKATPSQKQSEENEEDERVELPPPLAAVLARADIKITEVIDLSGLPPDQRPADFAWKSGKVFGGVRERRVPDKETLQNIGGQILGAFKSRCGGEFSENISKAIMQDGIEWQKADLVCKQPGRPVQVALLLYLTDTRLFSMFLHEAPLPDGKLAIAARDALTKTILELAKTEASSKNP